MKWSLERCLVVACSVAIVAMIVLMNTEIGLRYLFGRSLRGAEEYSNYLFCFLVLFGFYPALMRGRFLRIHGVLDLMAPRLRAVVEVVVALVSAAFAGLLAFETAGLVALSHSFGSVSQDYSRTPLMYPQLILPAGLTLLAVAMLLRGLHVARALWQGRTEITEDERDVVE